MNEVPHDELRQLCRELGVETAELGVIVVDHGSRREESNRALLQVVDLFQDATPFRLVEPAHMELAEPSLQTAFDRLVAKGAKFVVVHPYFLLPGRHWAEDIPALAAQAAAKHDHVRFLVTAPLGIHPAMSQIMQQRIVHCMRHVAGETGVCDLCEEPPGRCKLDP